MHANREETFEQVVVGEKKRGHVHPYTQNTHTHTRTHTHTHAFWLNLARRGGDYDSWCRRYHGGSIAGIACHACHLSGTFISLWHKHVHASVGERKRGRERENEGGGGGGGVSQVTLKKSVRKELGFILVIDWLLKVSVRCVHHAISFA